MVVIGNTENSMISQSMNEIQQPPNQRVVINRVINVNPQKSTTMLDPIANSRNKYTYSLAQKRVLQSTTMGTTDTITFSVQNAGNRME